MCPFCRSCVEGRDYLFLLCNFSQRIWKTWLILRWIGRMLWIGLWRIWKGNLFGIFCANLCLIQWSIIFLLSPLSSRSTQKKCRTGEHGNTLSLEEQILHTIDWKVPTAIWLSTGGFHSVCILFVCLFSFEIRDKS